MTVSESCEVSISREQSAKYAPYIYVVSLSHPTLLYHKDHTYMKGSAWFETFTAIFMFLHISIANCLQNYRKKTKQQNF